MRGGQRGFTLPELIIVIVITGVVAATLTVFFRPAIAAWLALRVRADLTEQTANALNLMRREVRLAVPNSIRTPNSQCVELVPTIAGGRFRREPDTTAAGSAALDVTQASTQFDVLTTLTTVPSAGDWIVVDNQNPGDVYAGSNRAAVSAVSTPAASFGKHRITVSSPQWPNGYGGARFTVVPAAQPSVFYICSGAGESNGSGTGTLYRLVRGFTASYPLACPSTAGASVVATRVKSCSFVYDPNAGATQQSGFVAMQLSLERDSETVSLLVGAHVLNVP
jgi:MSHA biogenesis protein MshO